MVSDSERGRRRSGRKTAAMLESERAAQRQQKRSWVIVKRWMRMWAIR
jgi:hypothetical protein